MAFYSEHFMEIQDGIIAHPSCWAIVSIMPSASPWSLLELGPTDSVARPLITTWLERNECFAFVLHQKWKQRPILSLGIPSTMRVEVDSNAYSETANPSWHFLVILTRASWCSIFGRPPISEITPYNSGSLSTRSWISSSQTSFHPCPLLGVGKNPTRLSLDTPDQSELDLGTLDSKTLPPWGPSTSLLDRWSPPDQRGTSVPPLHFIRNGNIDPFYL